MRRLLYVLSAATFVAVACTPAEGQTPPPPVNVVIAEGDGILPAAGSETLPTSYDSSAYRRLTLVWPSACSGFALVADLDPPTDDRMLGNEKPGMGSQVVIESVPPSTKVFANNLTQQPCAYAWTLYGQK